MAREVYDAPPCLPAKSLFKRLLFALMSGLHIVLDNLGGLAGLHAQVNRIGTLERSLVQLVQPFHLLGGEVETQRGIGVSEYVSDGTIIQTQILWLIAWCPLSYNFGILFDIKNCIHTSL